MSLCVLAYPKFSTGDYNKIQTFRKHNDKLYYHVVEPHFTFVFPLTGLDSEQFIAEIKKQIGGFQPFDFCFRCSTLNKDAFNDYYHVFLVPDEGYSQTVKLHSKLYADWLSPYRILEIDYIPHIGIGNSKDPQICLDMVDSWNSTEFAIPGYVSILDIVSYENSTVQTLSRVPVGK